MTECCYRTFSAWKVTARLDAGATSGAEPDPGALRFPLLRA